MVRRALWLMAFAALAAYPTAAFCQTAAEANAAILARVNSPANYTNRVPLDLSGPSVTIVNSRPENGPFGPLVLTPIEPLSRQPYAYWPAFSPYWSSYSSPYARAFRARPLAPAVNAPAIAPMGPGANRPLRAGTPLPSR